MEIAISGTPTTVPHGARIQRVLRPGMTLYLGATCNDGRPITESKRYKEAMEAGLTVVHQTQPIEKIKAEEPQLSFADKYAPKSLQDVIGHKESIAQLTAWLRVWETAARSSGQKGALIVGPPGIGKTTTVHLVAKEAGYDITEYNASDTRSVSMLRGVFGLGMKRLRKEVIIMDEVDGLAERGGCGELAQLIRTSTVPILCIANSLPPKLAPLQKSCLVVKFSRPVRSTIAQALLGICKKEGIVKTKPELEAMCESSGNDIRSLLNRLEFGSEMAGEKDALLRMDLFSATQKLMSNRHLTLNQAEDLVYVDYGMVPLMVQEAYAAASRTIEEAADASEQLSFGDLVSRQQWKNQDWSLLPQVVHSTVAASRKRTGQCPFQIFPQLLGKNSKKAKHRRWMEDIGRLRGCSASTVRMNENEWIQRILLYGMTKEIEKNQEKKQITDLISRMDNIHLTRDQLMEQMNDTLISPLQVPTKLKTAITREYNKTHSVEGEIKAKRGSSLQKGEYEVNEDEDEEEDDVEKDEVDYEVDQEMD